jgi:hypothetical protein
MGTRTPEFDAYIEKAQPFAKPILKKVRSLFHKACPDVVEVLKWSHPSFEYKGILGGMAAFNQHAVWMLWKGKLVSDPTHALGGDDGRGHLKSVGDLPPDNVMLDLIAQAVDLNEKGVKVEKRKSKPKPAAKVPGDLAAVLKKNSKAAAAFEQFSPSHKREYIEWITEAKQEETRKRRLAQAIEWIAQGKPRNWKYMNCKK